jgi:hypothetical protein
MAGVADSEFALLQNDPYDVPVCYVSTTDVGCFVAKRSVQKYVLLSVSGKVRVMLTSTDEEIWLPHAAITFPSFRIFSGCKPRNYGILEEFRVLDFRYFKTCP